MMKIGYLDELNSVVKILLKDYAIKLAIKNLKLKTRETSEPFIWSVIDINSHHQNLPPNIKSVWIFVLKKGASSIAHYHPNSTQHTVMIEGKGKVRIKDHMKDLKTFDSSSSTEKDIWCIIDKNVPHEFFPTEDMVVISFHTCLPDELIEIKCESGEKRKYEK